MIKFYEKEERTDAALPSNSDESQAPQTDVPLCPCGNPLSPTYKVSLLSTLAERSLIFLGVSARESLYGTLAYVDEQARQQIDSFQKFTQILHKNSSNKLILRSASSLSIPVDTVRIELAFWGRSKMNGSNMRWGPVQGNILKTDLSYHNSLFF